MNKTWEDVENEAKIKNSQWWQECDCRQTEAECLMNHYRTSFYQIMDELREKIEKLYKYKLQDIGDGKACMEMDDDGEYLVADEVLSLIPKESKE